jgi:uncharacterized protein (TIGR03118 family)
MFRAPQRPRGDTRPRSRRPGLEVLEDRSLLSAGFLQTNLVSDIPGLANITDPNLKNPWGLTVTNPFWISDNQAGVSTLYNTQGAGNPLVSTNSLVVSIPSASGNLGAPTGIVNNIFGKGFFNVSEGTKSGSSVFIFDTEDGLIAGWSPGVDRTHALIAVNNPGAVYKGLAIGTDAAGDQLLYAADFGKGTIDVFDKNFQSVDPAPGSAAPNGVSPVKLLGSFTDPQIPKGFAPFNVQAINGLLYVEYARVDPNSIDDLSGPGQGFVDVFNGDGVLQQHLIAGGRLNSPWGVALAPANFGAFGNDLLVGNDGDGTINAFDPHNGAYLGTLSDQTGRPIVNNKLWALGFGTAATGGNTSTLYFTAGIHDEQDGLFGTIQAVPFQFPQASIVPNLANAAAQNVSTVPANGDQNPYGVAFVPSGFRGHGVLQPGDVLVSNFNNSNNQQGTGSTIMRVTPQGGTSVFFQGPAGAGLTTALGVLKNGFVLVGSLPTTYSASGVPTIHTGALYVLDANGKVVEKLTGPKLDSPWDLTINDNGTFAQVFVSNVVSGTVTRLDLLVPPGLGAPLVFRQTVIASGFKSEPNGAALILGPTGLAFDARTDTLYVASTADNAIFAIPNAAFTTRNEGTGRMIFQDPHLRGPLGLVLAPNGDLIAANGDAVNADPTQPSELVEFTPQGQFVGQFPVDPGTGGAFGLAVTNDNGVLRLAAVDDVTNSLEIWTFQT